MPDSSGPQEGTTRHINDNPDSLEIGTPAKGGAIKMYGNYADPEEFKAKLANAWRSGATPRHCWKRMAHTSRKRRE